MFEVKWLEEKFENICMNISIVETRLSLESIVTDIQF